MLKFNRNLITNELLAQNPWWENGKNPRGHAIQSHRDLFGAFLDRVKNRELITGLVGLRRVGKSTLIQQAITDLLNEGNSPKSILYFLFEELPSKNSCEILRQILDFQIGRKVSGKNYVFLDEIQYVDGWNSLLKYYFDLYPQLKIVVSGSASLFIHTSAKESLAGRIQELVMRPMGYGEYLRINSKEDSEINFRHYLSWGEFPYLEKLPGWEEKSEYVNEFVFKKVVEHDLPKLKKVYGNELSNMLKLLITHSGQIIEIQNLAADLGIAQNTAREYLKLLEDTHLISQVFNLGLGFRTRSMKQRKVYGSSVNAQVLSSIGSIDSEIWSKDIGLIIETFVYNHLLRKSSGDIVFWRQRQVREVDFVLVSSGEKLPIEVKYQNQLKRKDLDNILYYCEKEKLKKAMVVTKFESGVKKIGGVKIDFRPANMLMD